MYSNENKTTFDDLWYVSMLSRIFCCSIDWSKLNLKNRFEGLKNCFEIILQVGFSYCITEKKRITTKLSHYHLIKQIREHFFYPEMWSISQKTNLKKLTCF